MKLVAGQIACRAGRGAGPAEWGAVTLLLTVSQSNCRRQNPEPKTPVAVFSLLELELCQKLTQRFLDIP